MRSKSPVFLIIVLILTAAAVFGLMTLKPAYGLDVQGGVRLTYSIDDASFKALKEKNSSVTIERVQSDLVRIMQNRVSGALGATEATASPKGSNQIIIEVPGYTDIENARKTLNSTAKISIFWAKNVSRNGSPRLYSADPEHKSIGGVPTVDFSRGTTPVRFEDKPAVEGEKTAYQRMIEGWEVILEGAEVSNAQVNVNGTRYQPEFTFSPDGARKMEEFSRRHPEENIAFVLDGRVLQIAPIKKGTILSDNAYIDGEFDPVYVRSLVALVKAGALPVDLKEESALKVDPTIGAKAKDQMIFAGVISLAIVAAFLLVYYAFAGLIATIGLALYVVFTITVLMLPLVNATFSLAAIAALILSVGMAVDANILVFERLKEELRLGKPIYRAADLGFKHAFSAIFDSNLSTILTSFVLFLLGTGPVKGFATTLILGVAISFVTAFAVTRSILLGLLGMGVATNPKLYAVSRNWFGEKLEAEADTKPINVLGKTKLYFGISIALVVAGWIFVGMGGLKPNVEFTGGYEAVFQVPAGQTRSAADIRAGLDRAGLDNANIKFGEGPKGQLAYITVPAGGKLKGQDQSAKEQIAAAAGLPSENADLQDVGATVSAETNRTAVTGVVVSSILIMLFLAIRFGVALGGFKNGIKFGGSALIALLHDVLFVIGLAGTVGYLLGWEISSLFITAMLTVIGFSVHDTIVIFDRIRENLRKPHRGQTFEHLVNKSITQSFARSVNTSFTAILTLIILIAVGTTTPDLKFMCVTMLAGIVVGTYSSIFNASPILYLWDKAVIKKHGVEAGLMAESARELTARAHAVAQAHQPTVEGQYGTVKRKTAASKATQIIDDTDDDK